MEEISKKIVVTIGRQFGSGGRVIGKKIAEQLGIAFYDKELIERAANESGIDKSFFQDMDEKKISQGYYSLASNFSLGMAFFPNESMLSGDSMFLVQSDVIRKIALQESCVLVGRCADYILRNQANKIDIFIYANKEERIKQVMKYNGVSEAEAENLIKKVDKERSSYYNYYTDKKWGVANSYHLCVNSSLYGVDKTAELILPFILGLNKDN